jgi:hypothetical protein
MFCMLASVMKEFQMRIFDGRAPGHGTVHCADGSYFVPKKYDAIAGR